MCTMNAACPIDHSPRQSLEAGFEVFAIDYLPHARSASRLLPDPP